MRALDAAELSDTETIKLLLLLVFFCDNDITSVISAAGLAHAVLQLVLAALGAGDEIGSF